MNDLVDTGLEQRPAVADITSAAVTVDPIPPFPNDLGKSSHSGPRDKPCGQRTHSLVA